MLDIFSGLSIGAGFPLINLSLAASTALSFISRISTGISLSAQRPAMPAPIVPPPRTATDLISFVIIFLKF